MDQEYTLLINERQRKILARAMLVFVNDYEDTGMLPRSQHAEASLLRDMLNNTHTLLQSTGINNLASF